MLVLRIVAIRGAALLGAVTAHTQSNAPATLDHVRLQLKWKHNFQFAGYYTAIEKGYYSDAGLEVEVAEGRVGINFVAEVLEGRAQFATEMPDLLLRRIDGAPVVVLAVTHQHSPMGLVCRKDAGINSPHDLAGKRVMFRTGSEAEIRSMIRHEGVPEDSIVRVEHTFGLADLAAGNVDATPLYFTSLMHAPEWDPEKYTLLKPINYGIDFYGDCLFTSEAQIRDHPDRVRAFRAASLKGWEYAMIHPEEISHLIHDQYAPDVPVEDLIAEAESMQPLFMHKFIEVGLMNPGRWRHIGDTFVELGMLDPGYSLDGFLYDPDPPASGIAPWLWGILAAIAVVTLVFAATTLVLAAYNRQLNRAVDARTAELEQSNRALNEAHALDQSRRAELDAAMTQLRATNEELGRFTYSVSHDLKSPLITITSFLQLLQKDLDKENRPAIADDIAEIANAAGAMGRLMDDLLELSRVGRIINPPTRVNLNELAADAVRLCREQLPEGANITIDPGLPTVSCDSGRMLQVFLNLIQNAIKFARENDPPQIHIGLRESNRDHIRFYVQDNGIGVQQQDQARIFQNFERLNTEKPGSGIGLALVKRIIESHKGRIWIESEGPQKGATFVIELPAA